jgi:hypothetical protein
MPIWGMSMKLSTSFPSPPKTVAGSSAVGPATVTPYDWTRNSSRPANPPMYRNAYDEPHAASRVSRNRSAGSAGASSYTGSSPSPGCPEGSREMRYGLPLYVKSSAAMCPPSVRGFSKSTQPVGWLGR